LRYIIYGAGGIGCTIGGRLHQSGHDVVLIARGAHLDAMRQHGLLLRAPEGDSTLHIPVAGHPNELTFAPGDVVILTMKTQDTEAALRDLELAAGTEVPVICAQNGVENERLALRRFPNVYAMLVALPATFLEPGVVIASAAPLSGALHAGRYPSGTDAVIKQVCEDINASHFISHADEEVMRFKYRKLLLNLGNALEVATQQTAWGATGPLGEFAEEMRQEGLRCFAAAGIEAMPADEYQARVSDHYKPQPIDGQARSASSTRQGLMRGNTVVESDYLNGEIELLGALHGVPTPYNTVIRRTAVAVAAKGEGARAVTLDELRELVSIEAKR
jgi:2-dehydropantoate 2-reductase